MQDNSCLSRAACIVTAMSGSKDQSFFFLDSGFLQSHFLVFWPASDATRLGNALLCLVDRTTLSDQEMQRAVLTCSTFSCEAELGLHDTVTFRVRPTPSIVPIPDLG